MPDTQITVARGAQALTLVIRLPMSDLLLALPPQLPRDSNALLGRNKPDLLAYFAAHTRLLGNRGQAVRVVIGSIRMDRQSDENVGNYAELEVSAYAPVGGKVPLLLAYDGVMHRVANHRAIVHDRAGHPLGIIRYSLATKTTAPLRLPAAPIL